MFRFVHPYLSGRLFLVRVYSLDTSPLSNAPQFPPISATYKLAGCTVGSLFKPAFDFLDGSVGLQRFFVTRNNVRPIPP